MESFNRSIAICLLSCMVLSFIAPFSPRALADNTVIPIHKVTASSMLKESNGTTYPAKQLIDGKKSTYWAPARRSRDIGNGLGEYVDFEFKKASDVQSIQIMNGYSKNEDVYYKNSRARRLDLYMKYTGSTSYSDPIAVELEDGILGFQTVSFDAQYDVEAVRVYIRDIYPGEDWAFDICISDVEFIGFTEDTPKNTSKDEVKNPRPDSSKVSIENVTSSSTLKESSGTTYPAKRLIDGNKSTYWAPARYSRDVGNGMYEYIDFEFEKASTVQSIRIINGYAKNESVYYKNSRVKQLELHMKYSGSSSYSDPITVEFEDDTMGYQEVFFDAQYDVEGIRAYITDIYQGSEWAFDICISEVEFTEKLSSDAEESYSSKPTITTKPTTDHLSDIIKVNFDSQDTFDMDFDGDNDNDRFTYISNGDYTGYITLKMSNGDVIELSDGVGSLGGILYSLDLDGNGQNEILIDMDSGGSGGTAFLVLLGKTNGHWERLYPNFVGDFFVYDMYGKYISDDTFRIVGEETGYNKLFRTNHAKTEWDDEIIDADTIDGVDFRPNDQRTAYLIEVSQRIGHLDYVGQAIITLSYLNREEVIVSQDFDPSESVELKESDNNDDVTSDKYFDGIYEQVNIDCSKIPIPQSFQDLAEANVAEYQKRAIPGLAYSPVPLEKMTLGELNTVQYMLLDRNGIDYDLDIDKLDLALLSDQDQQLMELVKQTRETLEGKYVPIEASMKIDLDGDGQEIAITYKRIDEDNIHLNIGDLSITDYSVSLYLVPMNENRKAILIKTSGGDPGSTGYVVWENGNGIEYFKSYCYYGVDSRFDKKDGATIENMNFPVLLLDQYRVADGHYVRKDELLRQAFTVIKVGSVYPTSLSTSSTRGKTITFTKDEMLWVVAYDGHYVALMDDHGTIGFIYVDSSYNDDDYQELVDNDGNYFHVGDYFEGFCWMS